MTTHMVIPDTQVKSDVDLSHLPLIGKYIVEKRPDVIVMIGDWADMPSLSSYDQGKKSFEGRRYNKDIKSAIYGMRLLLGPLKEYNKKAEESHKSRYRPRMILTLGNHEDRISRVIESDPKLDGTISLEDLKYKDFGWEVRPFLEIINVDGINYSHYFCTGAMGRPAGSARAIITKQHASCTQGHVQKTDIAMDVAGDGREIIGLMAGAAYLHQEPYLGSQGNNHRRHIVMKYRVNNGSYDPHFVSLDYLFNHYGEEKGKHMFKGE